MNYDPQRHYRHSIRLQGYDYSQAGAYFITLCTHQREMLFGTVVERVMQYSRFGEIVKAHWENLPTVRPCVDVDAFVVMPNHLHGILLLMDGPSPRPSLSEVIRGFKSYSARAINYARDLMGAPVWQRNYYERIIRNETMLEAIQRYIEDNPANWECDPEHMV